MLKRNRLTKKLWKVQQVYFHDRCYFFFERYRLSMIISVKGFPLACINRLDRTELDYAHVYPRIFLRSMYV